MDDDLPEECCAKCRFSGRNEDFQDQPVLSFDDHTGWDGFYCRRYPPSRATETPPDNYPSVRSRDWCGEFQPRKDAKPPENPILDMPIRDMYVSVRCRHSLRNNVNSVRDLVAMTPDQVLQIRNLGETSLTEIREWLSAHGLYLKGDTWRRGDS